MDIKPWLYKEKPFGDTPEGFYSFVYLITNNITGNKYIGKKLFWFKARKKITLKNGSKKLKRILVESDWRDYFGSSDSFNEDISKYGKESFTRTILHLCRTKSESSYLEAYEQFLNNVLLSDQYSNGWIMVRVRRDHLVKFREGLLESTSLAKLRLME
jgi:hypothetical protein